ncbi:MAG: hypothetical protein VYA30_02540 [Myxococcota bacterium]|nr:hypothetical protein [Myxococcota bacterium]
MDQGGTWGVNWPVGSTQFAYTSLDGCCSFPGAGTSKTSHGPRPATQELLITVWLTHRLMSHIPPIDSTIDLTGLDAVTAEDMTALIDGPI